MHEVPLFCMLRTDATSTALLGAWLSVRPTHVPVRVLHLVPGEQDTIGKFVMLTKDTPRKTGLKTWRLLVYFKHTMRKGNNCTQAVTVVMQDMVQYTAQSEEKNGGSDPDLSHPRRMSSTTYLQMHAVLVFVRAVETMPYCNRSQYLLA